MLPLPWSGLILAALALFLSLRKGAALLLVLALLAGSATLAVREFSLAHGPLQELVGEEVSFSAVVVSDPSWRSGKVRGAQRLPTSATFIARLSEVHTPHQVITLRTPIRILSKSSLHLIPGETFHARASITHTRERKVAALFILTSIPRVTHRANFIQSTTTRIRHRFSDRSQRIAGDSGALIPGLVLGDTSRESESFISAMRKVGLTHLTAVSGENFAIIAATLLWLSQWIFRRRNVRIVLTCLALILFIFLVRPSPSVLRASVMTGVLMLAKIKGSRADPLASLGFAIGILILFDPFQALDAGFALSVAATAGILLLSQPIAQYLESHLCPKKLSEFLAILLSATALCTPIIIAISGQLSIISIPVNLIVSLAVAPITIVGFVAALVPWNGMAHIMLVAVNPFAHWISWVARTGENFPVLNLPRNLLGIALVGLGIYSLLLHKWKHLWALITIVALIFFIPAMGWPGSQWRVANCNVGQGDALVLNLGDNQAIVIDVGPDPLLMRTCLRDLGVKTIPLLVLTHFHADHVGGLAGVLRSAKVKSLWISPNHEPIPEYESVMAQTRGIPITEVHQGQSLHFISTFGKGVLQVMWPNSDTPASDSFDGSSINNSSIAMHIELGNISIFAAGDIEPPAQAELVAAGELSPVDILKVAHHGSAYQDPWLYQILQPKMALISVGAGNSYGHPAQRTVSGLKATGARVLRTDIDGAISIDSSLRIRTNKKAWWKITWG